jgi:ABC-type spermidine/putrescine transport system permease subunit I
MTDAGPVVTDGARSVDGADGDRRGAWFPRWFWPSFAAPATLVLVVFFVLAFYATLAVAFGGIDPILQTPAPAWNPLTWRFDEFSYTISNLTHSDGIFYAAFFRTLGYVAIATVGCAVIGYPFAYFLARHAGRWRGLFLALFLAPFWISYMLRMTAWIGLLEEEGLVNRTLERIGAIDAPIGFLNGHAGTLIFGLIYGYVPFMILPLFAVLDRIPASNLEAARDLGASPTQTFLRVTLPASRQGLIAGAILCALPMFGDYFTQQLLADSNGTRMLGNFIVESLRVPIFVSRGASLILLLVVLLTVPIVYYLRSSARAARERA